MRVEDVLKIKRELFEKADALTVAKGHDYSFGVDTFRNLRNVERLGICETQTGVLVRLIDKISRLITFDKVGCFQVENEKLEDTVVDAINYLCYYFVLTKEEAEESGG